MATLIRVNCAMCSTLSDLPTEEILLDTDEENILILYYTCPNCGEFNERQVPTKHLERLEKAGVFSVDEMAAWIIEDLEGEL